MGCVEPAFHALAIRRGAAFCLTSGAPPLKQQWTGAQKSSHLPPPPRLGVAEEDLARTLMAVILTVMAVTLR